MILTAIAFLPLAVWVYLLLGRGGFWRCREHDDTPEARAAQAAFEASDEAWPSVIAVVPARNEAAVITQSLTSLLEQDYPGPFAVVLVDDESTDATASVALAAAQASGAVERLRIVPGRKVPPGWTGKLWAMKQGLEAIEASAAVPELVLFSDADIAHQASSLGRLVAIARRRRSVLTSLMVKLRCDSAAERWLVPAFVFFFQKLYPFAWVNDPARRTAAAAGGCMLVAREPLTRAGGLEAIRDALIDDCALAALMKRQGPIWLGLTEHVQSLRPYPSFGDIRQMVARSAYAELRYSFLRLLGTFTGMMLVYVAPVLFAAFARGARQDAGVASLMLMMLAFVPALGLYGLAPARALALPAIALAYTAFALDSAVQYWRGQGGYWKGRFQAPRAGCV